MLLEKDSGNSSGDRPLDLKTPTVSSEPSFYDGHSLAGQGLIGLKVLSCDGKFRCCDGAEVQSTRVDRGGSDQRTREIEAVVVDGVISVLPALRDSLAGRKLSVQAGTGR